MRVLSLHYKCFGASYLKGTELLVTIGRCSGPFNTHTTTLSEEVDTFAYLSGKTLEADDSLSAKLGLTSPSGEGEVSDIEREVDEEVDATIPMSRSPLHRPSEGGRSKVPLLQDESDQGRPSYDAPPDLEGRSFMRSRLRSRSPDSAAVIDTRKKYTYAAFFLVLSLITFTVQTETAVYIQHELGWNKAYCMLYFTHGSWSLLWPTQLLVLKLRKPKVPWRLFWRQHVYMLRTTAQMVESQDLHPSGRAASKSPIPYFIKMIAFLTSSLTIAGGSWYVAVNLTTASDLTAIYNCSAFFAYAFSIPLLREKARWQKTGSVLLAIIGVLIVAYGDSGTTNTKTKPGESAKKPARENEAKNRLLGNIIIGIGSVLYGFYEVLYKKLACPPEGTSPGRGMVFANAVGSMIGLFTLLVLWIPLPILHMTGLEPFELPRGKAAWMLMISVLANAVFSGSFLVLISLTSPVLSSVAALLTIFIVAIVDWLLTGQPLHPAALGGGSVIIVAFIALTVTTWYEMNEEEQKKSEIDIVESDDDDDD
ncbi:MAG: hypothetical protein M1816_007761 [Peltula sp. TS41687]|nr:MAG: hypothetical protein M1816_007761 [Peltula sp. TS41687]